MRQNLTTAAEVVGAVSVTTGAALVAVPLAFVIAGCFLIAAGYLGGRL